MDPAVRRAWNAARPTSDHVIDVACPAPWVSLEFDPAGWVYACCAGHLYPLGRIGDHRLEDIWNGPRVQALREALARWDLSVSCAPCRWHLEHARMDPVAIAYDLHRMETVDPLAPTMMQFALSNRCNYACAMCNAELSSRLRVEAGLAPLGSPYDDAFFADLEPLLAGLRLAKFQGGEPFLVAEHHRVWELLDRLEHPPELLITTNGSVWNDRVEWLLDRFSVQVSVSVDAATASTYETVRRGGDFDRVRANVDRFEAAGLRRGVPLHVSFCLLDANWRELGPFLQWAERFEKPATVNLVSDQGLALHDLPLDQLDEVARVWREQAVGLERALDVNREVWETQRRQLDAVIRQRRDHPVVPPRQPERVPPSVLSGGAVPAGGPSVSAPAVAEHRRRLAMWAEGGAVGELLVDAVGSVLEVISPHLRLGLDAALVGRHVDELPSIMEHADGRPIWLLDSTSVDDAEVRTFALSPTATRGTPGSVVRVLVLAADEGGRILIAEDRMYETTEQAVPLIRRRG